MRALQSQTAAIPTCSMWFKKSVRYKVYHLYLRGWYTCDIAMHLDMDMKDVDEIIDYMNFLFC